MPACSSPARWPPAGWASCSSATATSSGIARAEYYSRPIKGSWKTEGGGALINQAIHQVDILRWLAGPVAEVFAAWQLGALHKIESEDVVNAVVRYASGATGVIQAATAFWPGYPERIEFHGTRGTAVVTGDKLTTWDVEDDSGEPAPRSPSKWLRGASDPMAISLEPFERQFRDFGDAIAKRRSPWWPAKKATRHWKSWTPSTAPAARAKKWFCKLKNFRGEGLWPAGSAFKPTRNS